VSNVSVLNWIRKFGEKAAELRKNNDISIVEVDEMWNFIKKEMLSIIFC